MAKRTIETIIPARLELTRTTEITVCDLCGNPYAKTQPVVYECTVCGRTACTKCSHEVAAGLGSGDAVLCSRCYPFRDAYAAALTKLDDDYEDAVKAAMDEWRRESMKDDSL